ncbi:hypothetical protein REPUB_Repub20aG0075300 [Reevesia pubescens]
MDKRENWEKNDEEQWMENWDRRRRMAVVQVLCYVIYAIYVYHVYYSRLKDVPGKSSKGKKRKGNMWEREFKKIRDSISNVVEAIREGNAVMERGQAYVYSEEEVFEELVNIGVEKHLIYSAYRFLIEDPARARAFFGFPAEERKDYLIQMMYGPEDP